MRLNAVVCPTNIGPQVKFACRYSSAGRIGFLQRVQLRSDDVGNLSRWPLSAVLWGQRSVTRVSAAAAEPNQTDSQES